MQLVPRTLSSLAKPVVGATAKVKLLLSFVTQVAGAGASLLSGTGAHLCR